MPWTTKDVDKHKKGLSSKEKRKWVAIANSVLINCEKDGGSNCDAKAIRIANSQTKSEGAEMKVGKLPNGQEFKRVEEEVIGLNILEAQFLDNEKDGAKRVVLKVLQGRHTGHSGISKNGNFYSAEAAQSLVPLLETRRKMYLNHRQLSKFGRDMLEWTATVEEAWAKDGAAFVKVKMTSNPNTEWLFEEMKANPEEVGVSIFAMVRGKKGIVDKQEVFIVEGFTFLVSADFVGDPSAGGGVEKVIENQFSDLPESGMGEIVAVIEGTLAEKLEKSARRSKFYNIGYMVTDLMRSVAGEKNLPDEDKKKKIKEIADEFLSELEKINILDLFKPSDYPFYESIQYSIDQASTVIEVVEDLNNLISETKENDLVVVDDLFEAITSSKFPEFNKDKLEKKKKKKKKGDDTKDEEDKEKSENFSDKIWSEVDKSKLPASSFMVIRSESDRSTWYLPYKDEAGKVSEEVLSTLFTLVKEANQSNFSIPKVVHSQLKALAEQSWVGKITQEERAVNPDEIKGLTLEQILGAGNLVVTALNQAKSAAESQVTVLTQENQKKDEEIANLKTDLDKKNLAESERTRTDLINSLLAESKVIDMKNAHHVSETFMNQLRSASNDEAVKTLITDRENTISESRKAASGKILGNGKKLGDHGTPVTETETIEGYKLPTFYGGPQASLSNGKPISESSDEELAAMLR